MTDFNVSNGRYYDVNFFEYTPVKVDQNSSPHSAIFPEAIDRLSINSLALDYAVRARSIQGVNKTLWGIRNESGFYTVEFYFYYPRMYPRNKLSSIVSMSSPFFKSEQNIARVEDEESYYLSSLNLDDGQVSDINVYRSILETESEEFYFHDKGFSIDRHNPRFSSFSLCCSDGKPTKRNDYWGFFDGNVLHRVIGKVHELSVKKFPNENPVKAYDFLMYSCDYSRRVVFDNVLVADKENAIGLYFLHLDIDEYLNFLSCHNYASDFVGYIKENKKRFSHILFDVGIDFYLSEGDFRIKKTAFWGSL